MLFYPATVNFIVILMMSACMTQAYAAPVNELSADKKSRAVSVNAESSAAQNTKKSSVVKNRRTFPATGLSFGWPIKGRILKRFSPSHNKGIDIVGEKGQSVKATETGRVVYGGQGLIGFGKLLIIKHNDAYLSAYANASRLLVKEGQYVDKGQYIAEVGDVGIKRTSLHFEIRKNGKPVNPFILLPKK